MKPSASQFLAAVSLAACAVSLQAAPRPRYGGTLRLEVAAAVRSLDPSDWSGDTNIAAAKERLLRLVLDRLIELDESGRPQPSLALSWRHDAANRRWQFRLRPNVRFHDNSPLTAARAAAVLASANPDWQVSSAGESVVIQSTRPMPDLLQDLAQIQRSISARDATGAIYGTGPFRIAQWEPLRRAVLSANEDYWGGRPFLDSISFELGRFSREQLLDFELGKADVVEILPAELRRTVDRGAKTWSSAPLELLALVFQRGDPAVEDPRLREAIALSIDRAAIHNVLLQKQGEPAGSLLPQSLSGYAFLFPAVRHLERARELVGALQPRPRPLSLAYDPSDALARPVADRIAVNAREAGLILQAGAQTGGSLRLVRLRIAWMPPERALEEAAGALQLSELVKLPVQPAPEAAYAAERLLLESFRVVPLFHLPEVYAVSPRVKTWMAPGLLSSGALRLENVWLEVEKP